MEVIPGKFQPRHSSQPKLFEFVSQMIHSIVLFLEFAARLLNPSQKAQATVGKVLDGTLITWPKYIKRRQQFDKDGGQSKSDVQTATFGAHKSKVAWGGVGLNHYF